MTENYKSYFYYLADFVIMTRRTSLFFNKSSCHVIKHCKCLMYSWNVMKHTKLQALMNYRRDTNLQAIETVRINHDDYQGV